MSNYNKIPDKNTIDTVHIINIERTVLSSFLFDYKLFDKLYSKLKIESFYLEAHSRVFGSMIKLYKEGKPLDEEFIRKDINDTKYDNTLIDIMSTNPITNINAYVDVLQENHKSRELESIAKYLNNIAYDEKINTQEKINLLQKKISKVNNFYEKDNSSQSIKTNIELDKLSPYLSNLVKDLIALNDYPPSMVDFNSFILNGWTYWCKS